MQPGLVGGDFPADLRLRWDDEVGDRLCLKWSPFYLRLFLLLEQGWAQDLFLATRQVEDVHFEKKTVSFSYLGGFQISKSCKKAAPGHLPAEFCRGLYTSVPQNTCQSEALQLKSKCD